MTVLFWIRRFLRKIFTMFMQKEDWTVHSQILHLRFKEQSASLDVAALQEALGDEGTIVDLSGCTLDSVLYEVSAQRPVIAKTGDNTSVVIIGYDEYNTYLYDPQKGETYPYGMNDSTELFEKAGNIFISYVEKLKL